MTFGRFTVDVGTRQLLSDGGEIHLSPKAFCLLRTLIDARPRVLSKRELQEYIWPETFVDEANLSNLVAEVRRALGDDPRAPRFVRTKHGFGYSFCGELTPASVSSSDAGAALCRFTWGHREFVLAAGHHIIGRDDTADIRLDASTVSRRHASVAVAPGDVRIHDLDSKNGTFVGDARVTSPVAVCDGDIVRVGSLTLTAHVYGRRPTTATLR